MVLVEKVSWMESADLVFKVTLSRIQMIKLPPKLLNLQKTLKMQLKRLKPMLRPGSVSMAVSVVSLTQTPYLTLCEVPTATANTAPTAATVLVTEASATALKVLTEQLTRLQQSRLTFRARATSTITQQNLIPFLPLRRPRVARKRRVKRRRRPRSLPNQREESLRV